MPKERGTHLYVPKSFKIFVEDVRFNNNLSNNIEALTLIKYNYNIGKMFNITKGKRR